ncbi:hypothetical protein [uncultured Aquimarina sp.]|uniref:hypothetical protein n=1 Tax=uncultured Aquimarina sp. TaxID=575652 RepID=UPI002630D8A1|nr:hypothetical protein [uncultured Aquimarina sp.]
MKKITLLVVTAVFVIGMQSCSTEEDVFSEENVLIESAIKEKNGIPENTIHFSSKSFSKIPGPGEAIYRRVFVRFPEGAPYHSRLHLATVVGPTVFDDFYVILDNGCDYVDEWFIRCYTCGDYPQGQSGTVDAENIDKTEVSDDEFGQEGSNPNVYWNCSEVPPRSGLNILREDGDILILQDNPN